MSIEAMKQALDLLEVCNGAEIVEGVIIYTDKEITALRQAIEQAEKREWVGLTEEDEIDWEGGDLKSLVKAIEAKLKEKNQ